MGVSQTFRCDRCGYAAMIGGGRQIGLMKVLWTIRCHDCAELRDVLVSDDPWTLPKGWTPTFYTCPVNEKHRVELWSRGGRCPKCSGAMAVDRAGPCVRWD